MFFGKQVWDPAHIIAQIVAVQCMYYMSLAVLMKVIAGPYVNNLNVHQIFDWQWVGFHSFQEWTVVIATFCNAVVAGFILRIVVQRAKKCLDFGSTIYAVHLLCVTLYSSFPSHIEWWLVNALNIAVTAGVGEWLCFQKELQEIPLATIRRPAQATELTGILTQQ